MTSAELLAGDFLKNLLQNFPKEENSFQEKEQIEIHKENPFQ